MSKAISAAATNRGRIIRAIEYWEQSLRQARLNRRASLLSARARIAEIRAIRADDHASAESCARDELHAREMMRMDRRRARLELDNVKTSLEALESRRCELARERRFAREMANLRRATKFALRHGT